MHGDINFKVYKLLKLMEQRWLDLQRREGYVIKQLNQIYKKIPFDFWFTKCNRKFDKCTFNNH